MSREHEHTTDALTRLLFESIRWPNGIICPACDTLAEHKRLGTRPKRISCARCHHQFSVTSGTYLHRCRVPLSKVHKAIRMIVEEDASNLEIMRELGMSQKGMYRLVTKIRRAIAQGWNGRIGSKRRRLLGAQVLFQHPQIWDEESFDRYIRIADWRDRGTGTVDDAIHMCLRRVR